MQGSATCPSRFTQSPWPRLAAGHAIPGTAPRPRRSPSPGAGPSRHGPAIALGMRRAPGLPAGAPAAPMVSPEGLVAAAAALAGLGLLARRLWAGRLEVPGDRDEEEEEEEEGIPFMAEDGSGCCRLLCKPSALAQHLVTGGLLQLGLRALERGFLPVIFNRRGHNGCPLTTPRLQPFGDPGDLREAVTYLRCRHPAAPLLAVSEGSGSGLLLAYLGESGSSSHLAAAACVSPIFRGRDWFEAGMPWLYEWPLLLHLKRGLSRYAGSLAQAVDVDGLLGSRSLRELEEALFCRTKSRPTSWEAYWERNEPLRDADEAAVPVLCLCSADDPVRGPPARSLPLELFRSSPYFFLLLTPRGGHCGFPRRGPGHCWGHEAVLEFFRAMAEFLGAEERRKGLPWPRRWGGPAVEPPVFTWQRSYTR
ncbi:protein ABHD15 isoform X2 [Chroicocephalus ridibundus]|uniref:protein ABHD15 isoform X2 n=1 Tax=Chroicocephalus ridibundus TaxID=1192867 RepID=UPI002FDF01EE